MAQWVKPASHMSTTLNPGRSTLNPTAADAPWKAAEHGLSVWASAVCVGDPRAVSGSWFQPGPVVLVAIWGVNQPMEIIYVFLSFYNCLSNHLRKK